MSDNLTKHERSCLIEAEDWIAPFEVVLRLYPHGSTIRQRNAVSTTMKSLRDKYLLRFAADNGTYRRTDRGNVALSTAR